LNGYVIVCGNGVRSMKAWIVTVDGYDSWEILGVFASKEGANKFRRKHKRQTGDYSNLSEWEVQE
jgi:hypothetical protein